MNHGIYSAPFISLWRAK